MKTQKIKFIILFFGLLSAGTAFSQGRWNGNGGRHNYPRNQGYYSYNRGYYPSYKQGYYRPVPPQAYYGRPVYVAPPPVYYAPRPVQRVWIPGYWTYNRRGFRIWINGFWRVF